jgi:hypothetical protein
MYVYIYIQDGLGNQLFKIAAAYAYAKDTGRTLKVIKNKRREDSRITYWDTALKRCVSLLVCSIPDSHIVYRELRIGTYNKIQVYSDTNVLMEGWFNSPKYFQSYKEDICSLFYPDTTSIEKVNNLYGQYLGPHTVTVHARRGDYIRFAHEFGPLTSEYYKSATNIITENILNPIFLLISDDDSYWTTIRNEIPAFQDFPTIVISRNTLTDYETLALFSQVEHLIIANSTFSWWGAYLANAKTVISPKQWWGPNGVKDWNDIYCDNWIRV